VTGFGFRDFLLIFLKDSAIFNIPIHNVPGGFFLRLAPATFEAPYCDNSRTGKTRYRKVQGLINEGNRHFPLLYSLKTMPLC